MAKNQNNQTPRIPSELWLQALLFLGVIALPVLLAGLTGAVAFERSKSVQFCSSCHVMEPFVHGVESSKSELLSAKHFQRHWINHNSCYTCHTDYDFLGPMSAKIRGLRHLYANAVGVKGRPKLYKPFPNGNCLQCHGKTFKFLEHPAHAPILEELQRNKISCIDCHGPVHPGGPS
ncbi:MAG: hypothetical protein COV48_01515 [Elusimicrobia bacterium CG11_big_fil_rev_8_21_14_0_20_64_6]|nr:MAG: hypothetical protein COV48_01515 [Elusimicrobia bacterium CG11_big_fil_rev_8_21_14_0_20_64_6]